MIPQKDKTYALVCLGPFDYNVYKGPGVHTGVVHPEEGWFEFKLPIDDDQYWFAEEDIIGELVVTPLK